MYTCQLVNTIMSHPNKQQSLPSILMYKEVPTPHSAIINSVFKHGIKAKLTLYSILPILFMLFVHRVK